MPWIPGAEQVYSPEGMADPQNVELEFSVADAERRNRWPPRQYAGDIVTIQMRARPRVVREAKGSFTEHETRGLVRMEDITRERLTSAAAAQNAK